MSKSACAGEQQVICKSDRSADAAKRVSTGRACPLIELKSIWYNQHLEKKTGRLTDMYDRHRLYFLTKRKKED